MSGLYQAALGIELRGIQNPYDPTGPQRDRALEVIQAVRNRLRPSPGHAALSSSSDRANRLREAVHLATDLSEWAVHRAAGHPLPESLIDLGARFAAEWQATSQSPVPKVWNSLPGLSNERPPF